MSSSLATILSSYSWSHTYPDNPTFSALVNFNNNRVSINPCVGGICNKQSGSFTLNPTDNTISFSHLISTMMLAPPEFRQYESFTSNLFSGENIPISAAVDEKNDETATLQIKDTTFVGTVNPEVKYGEPTRIFFDIQYGPYNPQNIGYTVREVEYAENGVKKSVGEWFVLNEPIIGFRPDSDHEYQIRLNRFFDKKNNKYIYKHDMNVVTALHK